MNDSNGAIASSKACFLFLVDENLSPLLFIYLVAEVVALAAI
jgi:hypothetical protein